MISRADLGEYAMAGCVVGVGMAVVPVATTLCLSNIRTIVNNVAMNLLAIPCGFVVYMPSVYPAIRLPMMWKFSMGSAYAGCGLLAISVAALAVDRFCLQSRSEY